MSIRAKVTAGVVFLLFAFVCASLAQQAKPPKKEQVVFSNTTMKEVLGEVTWIGKKFISIRYGLDKEKGEEYEILLPFDEKNLQLEHLQSFKQIEKGDTVRVQYQEDHTKFDSNREAFKRKAKGISFVKKGTPSRQPLQPTGQDTLTSY